MKNRHVQIKAMMVFLIIILCINSKYLFPQSDNETQVSYVGNAEELQSWRMPNRENTPPGLNGEYLGQSPPGDVPVVFAPGIISVDSTIEHGSPAFSHDGLPGVTRTLCG